MSAAIVRPDAFSATQIIATGYAFIGITSAVACARLVLYRVAPRRPTTEDALVFFAYISNIAMCSLYISLAPKAQLLSDVKLEKIPPYPTVRDDGRYITRRYFAAPLLFWMLLWSIKFNFLLMYKKLLEGISNAYMYVWWFIVFVCLVTQAGNFAAYLTACSEIRLLVNGGCKDMTTTRQLISLLYSYAADTVTNILIMSLPIRLVWNLQMRRSKKLGVMGLFATGAVCITVATIRVAQITKNVYQYDMGIDGTWLAIFGMMECSIAVIVGFVPSFAILFRIARHRKPSYNAQGYQKQAEGQSSEGSGPGVVLKNVSDKSSNKASRDRKKTGLETTDSLWADDAEIQEEVARKPTYHLNRTTTKPTASDHLASSTAPT